MGQSLVNRVEAEMVLCLFKELTAADPALRSRPAIAVISPYKAQVRRAWASYLVTRDQKVLKLEAEGKHDAAVAMATGPLREAFHAAMQAAEKLWAQHLAGTRAATTASHPYLR